MIRAKGRLPHKSRYDVTYDAVSQSWHGALEVPDPNGLPPLVLVSRASGVFKLLERLDDLYREYLKGGA